MQLFHIIFQKDWEKFQTQGLYTPPSLDQEGFIHCSTKEQVLPTANRRFQGQTDLLLLEIDSAKVPHQIKYDLSLSAGQKHPHIYGPLPIEAVITTLFFKPNPDGHFDTFPK
jgi:uncharacterized protein (DUF952 family)